uniref:Uncharacterized protein n=1 Tax=Oryza punctata TaxID=4537 RepID=A0A0E0JZ38_ORYPU
MKRTKSSRACHESSELTSHELSVHPYSQRCIELEQPWDPGGLLHRLGNKPTLEERGLLERRVGYTWASSAMSNQTQGRPIQKKNGNCDARHR